MDSIAMARGPELLRILRDRLAHDRDGIHGALRWARPCESGRRLSERTGANPGVAVLLVTACDRHEEVLTVGDVPVVTSWGADRPDPWRVAIRPHADRPCTEAARDPAIPEWACRRSPG